LPRCGNDARTARAGGRPAAESASMQFAMARRTQQYE
jgi:hypothetical protein